MLKTKHFLALLLTAILLLMPLSYAEEAVIEESEKVELIAEVEEIPASEQTEESTEEPTEEPASDLTEEPTPEPLEEAEVDEPGPVEDAEETADDAPVETDAEPVEIVPLPDAPRVIADSDWTYDQQQDMLTIPCTAGSDSFTMEWAFTGKASGFTVWSTPAGSDARTDYGFVAETFVRLPVEKYLDGKYVLHVIAVLEDGAQVEGSQLFQLDMCTEEAAFEAEAPEATAEPPVVEDDANEMMPQSAMCDYTVTADGVLTGGEITYGMEPGSFDMVIPDDRGIVEIGDYASFGFMKNKDAIRSVTVPEGVVRIGYRGLSECFQMKAVTLPSSLREIADGAFYNSRLSEPIVIPNGVERIGTEAFYATMMTSITVPPSVTYIGERAFRVQDPEPLLYDGNCTVYVTAGSYAEQYCVDNRLKYDLVGSGKPAVTKVTASATSVTQGGSVTFTVMTSRNAKYLTLYAASGSALEKWTASNSNSKVEDGVRTWTVSCKFSKTGNQSMKLAASENGTSYGVSKPVSVTVNAPIKVSGIALNKTSASLNTAKSETVTLTATVSPSNASNKNVTWKSSNTGVATVNSSGKVTAIAKGTAKITCTAADGSGVTATCTVTVTGLAKPKLTSVSNTATGIKIAWGKVSGASRYRVYYRTGTSGSFEKLINTSAGSYTWTGAKSGTTYNFTVRCLDSSGNVVSSYDSKGLSIKYIAAPKISSVTNAAAGIKISWGKVTGAARYRVYYRVGTSGTYKKLINTSAGSYTWTGAKSGIRYNFTVRCLNSSNEVISSYDSKGKTITYVAAPKLTAVTNTASGIKISWSKVTGATRYRVYYRVGTSGAYKKLINTSAGSYTWSGAKSGTKYNFTVRCLDSAGAVVSSYDSKGLTITRKK